MPPFSKDVGESALAKQIVRALRGQWCGDYGTACCPAHQDRKPSLSVTEKSGNVLFYCHAGCSQLEVIGALRSRGLWGSRSRRLDKKNEQQQPTWSAGSDFKDAERTRAALKIWSASEPASGTLADRYLRARGLNILNADVLRFHRGLKHQSGGVYPAMVALVTDGSTGEAVAIHRTFLSLDGMQKAPVTPEKMILGPSRGGAVRLSTASGLLLVGEGIETSLAAMQATGKPTWAALSTSGLKALDLPANVQEVVVLADGDDPGEQAALHAAIRWRRQGRRARIARPPRGLDFNDWLLGRSPPETEE